LYGIDELSLEQCKIFPNPTKGILNVQSDFNVKLIRLYDNQGKIVFSKTLNQKKTQIDVSMFEPGVYFISLEIEDKTVLRKIVVE
jgi:hypothetical protein